jgi:hypothetical protein
LPLSGGNVTMPPQNKTINLKFKDDPSTGYADKTWGFIN